MISSSTTVRTTYLSLGVFVGAGICSLVLNSYNKAAKGNMTPKTLSAMIRKRRSIFPKQYTNEPVDKTVLEAMLEAARWAPSHNLTEPWAFIIFETKEGRKRLGEFLATEYKKTCEKTGKAFSQKKYDKKISNATKSSFVVALICDAGKNKNPVVEEICSVAMAVQNMHLVATAHNVGAYWSSGSVHDKSGGEINSTLVVNNPQATRDFLGLKNSQVCLGWMFIGNCEVNKWPQGRRKELEEGITLIWN